MYSIWNPSLPSYTNQLFLSILSYSYLLPKKVSFYTTTSYYCTCTTYYTLYPTFFVHIFFFVVVLLFSTATLLHFFVFVLHTFCIIFFLSFMNKRTVFSLLFLFFIWYFFSFILVILVLLYFYFLLTKCIPDSNKMLLTWRQNVTLKCK